MEGWSRQAPPGFRFCFKLPQALTHAKRLRQVETDGGDFVEALWPLKDRLGPVMIQLPRRDINALLISHGANRVMLDVRPLFSGPPEAHSGLIQARAEKPRRPLHVISTAKFPVIRFIGHLDSAINEHYFTPWIDQLALWIKQGKTPFLFVHTADNRQAPELARNLYARVADRMGWQALPGFPGDRQNQLL